MIKSQQILILRNFIKFPRPLACQSASSWSYHWRSMKNISKIKKSVLPHEIAESEEQDISPKWGEILESDIGLDSIEDEFSEKEKNQNK